jgi:hypothetical protein
MLNIRFATTTLVGVWLITNYWFTTTTAVSSHSPQISPPKVWLAISEPHWPPRRAKELHAAIHFFNGLTNCMLHEPAASKKLHVA